MARYTAVFSAIALLAGTAGALRSQSISVTTSGVAPRGTIERRDCLTVSLAPNAAYECSDLRVAHPMPTTITMNKERTPTLLYNSRHSSVGMLIGANFTYSGSTPDSITATATVAGVPAVTRKYSWSASCNGAACRVVVPVFGADTATTGLHEFTIQVRAYVGGSPTTGSATDSAVLINRARSPFGAGWWLAGLEQFVSVSGTKKLLIGGDGSARLYTYTGSGGTYTVQPAYDRTDTLTDVGGGTWRRHAGDGAYVEFDASGRHTKTRNALGWETTFGYSGSSLTSIALPSGSTSRVYTLSYGTTSAGVPIIASVAAPAAASSRTTTFAASGSFITSITDPGMSAVNFAYSSNRMTSRGNRTADTTFFAYDASGGIDSAYISMSRTESGVRVANRFKPAETRSA